MKKGLKINLKTGKVTGYGKISERDFTAIVGTLRFNEMKPSLRDRVRKNTRKFFRCMRYALRKEEPHRQVTVAMPIVLECAEK